MGVQDGAVLSRSNALPDVHTWKNDNGIQILYYCMKKTQHRFPEHRMIVQQLESEGG